MRFLVTRPQADAGEFKAHLEGRGHRVTLAPLLDVSFADADPIDLDEVQALIATSKNGVRALARDPAFLTGRHLPLLAVGPGTASIARSLGFGHVVQGPRSARELVAIIAEAVDVNGGSLLHLAGDKLAYDVAADLQALGFHVLQPVVYNTRPVEALSPQVIREISRGEIDAVILLSPQTAGIWANLVRVHGILPPARRLIHVCLSVAVHKALQPLGEVPVAVAKEPNLDEILAAIDAAAAKWSRDNFE